MIHEYPSKNILRRKLSSFDDKLDENIYHPVPHSFVLRNFKQIPQLGERKETLFHGHFISTNFFVLF